jgi:hypothetical protein
MQWEIIGQSLKKACDAAEAVPALQQSAVIVIRQLVPFANHICCEKPTKYLF